MQLNTSSSFLAYPVDCQSYYRVSALAIVKASRKSLVSGWGEACDVRPRTPAGSDEILGVSSGSHRGSIQAIWHRITTLAINRIGKNRFIGSTVGFSRRVRGRGRLRNPRAIRRRFRAV